MGQGMPRPMGQSGQPQQAQPGQPPAQMGGKGGAQGGQPPAQMGGKGGGAGAAGGAHPYPQFGGPSQQQQAQDPILDRFAAAQMFSQGQGQPQQPQINPAMLQAFGGKGGGQPQAAGQQQLNAQQMMQQQAAGLPPINQVMQQRPMVNERMYQAPFRGRDIR